MADLTHLNDSNQPRMVDVSSKVATVRTATATCLVSLGSDILSRMENGELQNKKGPVLHTAILAGIMGIKKTSEIIPLCHPLPLDSAKVEITSHDARTLLVTATAEGCYTVQFRHPEVRRAAARRYADGTDEATRKIRIKAVEGTHRSLAVVLDGFLVPREAALRCVTAPFPRTVSTPVSRSCW